MGNDAGSAQLFPFVLPWDDASENITNVSGWLHKPAGSRGFVGVEDGHLAVGGERIRFFGMNICFDSCFPSHEQAEKIAARMARFGINCVRIHLHDTGVAPRGLFTAVPPEDHGYMIDFDPGQMDKLDYFTDRLMRHGVYVNLNLHVGRRYPGFAKWEGEPVFSKWLDLWHPQMIHLQKDFARDYLTHENAYTGKRYIDDPGVGLIEISNENGLMGDWWWWSGKFDDLPDELAEVLDYQWNEWLRTRYTTSPALQKAWSVRGVELGRLPYPRRRDWDACPPEHQRDWMRFLWDTEVRYWTGMYEHVKALGAKCPIFGTAANFSPAPVQAMLDIVDIHYYWQDPVYKDRKDRESWTIENTPMAGSARGGLIGPLSVYRIAGKPYGSTEYNHAAPNTYNTEAFLLMAAYGAMQDWDFMFGYTWSHDPTDLDLGYFRNVFDIGQHPTKLATFPTVAALFLRGDVGVPAAKAVAKFDFDAAIDLLRKSPVGNLAAEVFGIRREVALLMPVEITTDPDLPAVSAPDIPPGTTRFESANAQLCWDTNAGRGFVTIDTERTKGFIGYVGEPAALGGVVIAPAKNMQDWAAITLSVMEGTGFVEPGRVLVTATGYVENTDMGWKTAEKKSVGTNWGRAPSLVEGIPATITLPVPGNQVRAWALDERGARRSEVPVEGGGANAVIRIGPEHRTLWYEVEIA